MKTAILSLIPLLSLWTLPALSADGKTLTAKLDESRKVVRVEIDGNLFTELIYAGQPKPVLFPVLGPDDFPMLRQWPLAELAPGEEKDHPHHKGIWFTHGLVNGTDFWLEGPKGGTITVEGVPQLSARNGTVSIHTKENWRTPDGKTTVLTSATSITCGLDGGDRYIDYTIFLFPAGSDVLFGDTKEGTMGLRLNPIFNLKGEVAKGSVTTSEGKEGAAAWGTHAKWVSYTAPVKDGVLGVACFDHPGNLRHPTTWHARDYGLFAANPFGYHDFKKKPKGAGDYTLKQNGGLIFKYRWLFHRGDTATAKIGERWAKWAEKR